MEPVNSEQLVNEVRQQNNRQTIPFGNAFYRDPVDNEPVYNEIVLLPSARKNVYFKLMVCIESACLRNYGLQWGSEILMPKCRIHPKTEHLIGFSNGSEFRCSGLGHFLSENRTF